MMCEDINKLLAAYLDGEVTPEERSQIEAHLSSCGKCREELQLVDTTREGLSQALKARAAGVEPSSRAWDAVRQRITSNNSFWEQLGGLLDRPVWRAAIPVALVVVLAAGVLWRTGILPEFGGTAQESAPKTALAPETAPAPAQTPATPEAKALEPPIIFTAPPAPAPAPTTPAPGVAPPAITVQAPPPAQVTVPTPPAEGWMEKTISPNQSRTVNGITIILVRVEMTATGMKVYAFNTPPGYNLPQGPMLPPPIFMIHAEAEYSIDGGVTKKTPPSAIGFLENGMLHIWGEPYDHLDPVPKTAKELTFRITRLGDWAGPWEFKIPLQ